MKHAIKNFHTQFAYKPVIKNRHRLASRKKFVLVGMGGSRLAAALLHGLDPSLDIIIHNDYGLPITPKGELENRLIILSSYSGNTEEVLEALEEARKKNLDCIAISTGGKLIELACKYKMPHIQMPDTGIQPRVALGLSINAILAAINKPKLLKEVTKLAQDLKPEAHEKFGKELAKLIHKNIPVIYTSRKNHAIAYNWKIKLNETGKTVAFYNVLPELNHNEMTGFDVAESTKDLSKNFFFIILKDKTDHPKIQKRMDVLAKLYKKRGLKVKIIELKGKTPWHKIFSSLVTADWTALHLAGHYGVEAEEVPMVEEFKKLIS